MARGNHRLDQSLSDFLEKWFTSGAIDIDSLSVYLTTEYLDKAALERFRKLFELYVTGKANRDYIGFARSLIIYHRDLMNERGVLPWISVGFNDLITLHRSYPHEEEEGQLPSDNTWINRYYLDTLRSIYTGLHHTA